MHLFAHRNAKATLLFASDANFAFAHTVHSPVAFENNARAFQSTIKRSQLTFSLASGFLFKNNNFRLTLFTLHTKRFGRQAEPFGSCEIHSPYSIENLNYEPQLEISTGGILTENLDQEFIGPSFSIASNN